MPEPSVPIAGLDDRASPSSVTKSFSSEEQITNQRDNNHRTTTSRIEDTPEHSYAEISSTDEEDRILSPSFSPSPTSVISSNRALGKRREATPIDADDFEYGSTSKRRKTTGAPSNHPAASVGNRKVAVQRTHGLTRTLRISKPDDHAANKNKFRAPNSHTLSSASGGTRIAPWINTDDWHEDAQTSASSRSLGNVDKSTEPSADNAVSPNDHSLKPSDAGTCKRKDVELSDDEVADVNVAPKRQNTSSISLESVNQKVDACFDMISNMITNQRNLPEEYSEHVHQLIRTFKDPNGSIFENLIRDLDSQRSLKTKHRIMVQKLVEFVDLSNGTVFPKVPAQNEVDKVWTALYEHIVSTVGPNNITPCPTPEGAGYLTCAAEGIANGRIPDDQLETCVESLQQYLQSPHAQQTLFSALFSRWGFTTPEPMLRTMHSDGMMQLYSAVKNAAQDAQSEGLERVQHYDKVATKHMFEDADFQTVHVSRRRSEFRLRFEMAKEKLCRPSNIPTSLSPSRFAKEVVALKQKLLLSPKEYRIHFVRPGNTFRASRMRACDETNEPVSDEKAAGKRVLLCMFPMLTCEEPQAMKEDAKVVDVLCRNKSFFPTFKESMQIPNPELLPSKAVVLVSQD
ncbi:uncharacterized protein EKO05_0005881 [Ascochyta rabiei]|nr:uncharacterized protein EKO05_0005881 [Ascochyta rabiei]UPX15434.1 hypothetical protein EKO05_0005881 [Ascochyta rabiei]